MTARKAVRALLVAFAAFLLAAGAAPPATAQESPGLILKGGDDVSAQARHFNAVASWQILYQCPALGCNEGSVQPGEALGEICHLDTDKYSWALVYNRVNGHTGFVNRNNLIHKNSLGHCNSVGTEGSVDGFAPLYQCPATFCNQGSVNKGDHLRVECYVNVGDGWSWIWLYNRTNTHEGFLRAAGHGTLQEC